MAGSNNKMATEATQPQPGQVITPGGGAMSQPNPPTPQPTKPATTQPPAAAPAQSLPPAADETDQLAPSMFTQPGAADSPPGEPINWTASEFVAHEKSSSWYLGLAAAAAAIAGLVFLVTRDIISTSVVIVGAVALGVLAARKPRQQQYSLDAGGVMIGQKRYDYGLFRSFAIAPEGAFSSIIFMPLKRFAQTTTIYYAPEDEDKIVGVLSQVLPFEEHRADAVDNLMKRIRF